MGAEENTERIVEYMEGRKKAYPSDISDDLGIEYDEVGEIIDELKEAGIVEDAVDDVEE